MLLDFLLKVEDFRRKQGQQYSAGHVLYFSILAISSGSHSYRKVHQFVKSHFKKFKKKYGLNWKKSPCYNTIKNIITGVNESSLELIFRKHAKELSKELFEAAKDLQLSFDGKVVRGSFDHFKEVKAIQVLSIFCSSNDIILAHEEVDRKTNEIPVAQNLIPALKFKTAIYTCDALNCQEETVKIVIKAKSNLIVQVKGNQKWLLGKCRKVSKDGNIIDQNISETEKAHGRIETRTCKIYEAINIINDGKWSDIKTIIKVERETFILDTKTGKWKDRSETSYYIATNELTAKEYNIMIRQHWGIENKNHNVRDGAMKEDASRIRKNPLNMVKLRSFALNLMRYNGATNIEMEMYDNVLNINRLLRYKAI